MATGILDLNIFEQRFHNLFHEAPFSAALLSGDDLRIELANAVSLQLWGKDNRVIGKPLLEALPEMKDQEAYKNLVEVYRSGKTYEGKEQVAYLQKGGELKKIFVNFVFKAIKNDDDEVTGVFAVGYDVTAQVLARQQLQQSETRAKVAIESTGLGSFELNYKTGETSTSPRFNEIFGFDTSVAHELYVARIHPDDLPTRNEAHRRALKTGKLRYDARLILPDKTERWVQISGSVIFDDKHSPEFLIGTALDVTEEKRSLQKIQESEAKFRMLITETPDVGVGLYIGREMRIQYVNDVMLRFWGKDNSVIDKTLTEALPELITQPFFKQLQDVFDTGQPFIGKEVKALLERNGKLETGYYSYTYKALTDSTGKVYGIHHMAIDVTDQVTNKLKLIESENEVRNLFEQSPVGIAMFKGRDLVVELVNETLLSYWGRKREQVIDKPVFDALPELTAQGIKEIALEVFETGIPFTSDDTPVTLQRDGKMETIIVQFGFRAIHDTQRNTIGLLAIANEVTALVKSKERVEKNEMRLKFLADSMPQVVWIAEGDGSVTYYNNRVLQFAGAYQKEDGTWSWGGILHPDDLSLTSAAWQHAVATKQPYEMEHRVLMSDGSYRWHLSRAYAYETDEGTKWFGTATDVHDQKVLEMNLETLVKERTLELQRSNDDLQQFAHVASHDLKEPVRKIKTFSYKLQDEYKHVLGERGNNFVAKIIASSDRMNAMINGVLNYAAMPASSLITESIDLNTVIHHVESDLEILIHEKQATVNFPHLPIINGIRDLIHQLFYNLINNSIKFSKPGVPPIVNIWGGVATVDDKQYHEIILTDNGIGFEPQYSEQIFTSFFRLNSKDQFEGSGLGLALCKKIMERHGGMITAKGETGKGAQFNIFFPK